MLVIVMFVGVVVGVVFVLRWANVRIPTQSQRSTCAADASTAAHASTCRCESTRRGVMPIIFAQSLLMIPPFIYSGTLAKVVRGSLWRQMMRRSSEHVLGRPQPRWSTTLVYIAMIYFFCYFWTAITFNPKEISDNMKDNGTFIPGYRPGRRTEDYLESRD